MKKLIALIIVIAIFFSGTTISHRIQQPKKTAIDHLGEITSALDTASSKLDQTSIVLKNLNR